MGDKTAGPVIPPERGDARGKSLGATLLRLYRGNVLWRGALDLTLIGGLIMLLVNGLPLFFSNTRPSANFARPADGPDTRLPAPQLFPVPASENDRATVEWIGAVSPEDKTLLESALKLVTVDNKKVKELLAAGAEKGEPNFATVLAMAYVSEAYQNKSAEDREKAYSLYRDAAAKNHPTAQYQLGSLYEHDPFGTGKQPDEAMKWYKTGAENPLNKSGDAEYCLGGMYQFGTTSAGKNTRQARKYFAAAAAKGNTYAQSYLASLDINSGAADDGISLLKIAAEKGDDVAQVNLAIQYLYGRVTGRPDYAQFIKWAGLSADQGRDVAMLQLGNFYRHGAPGFPPDPRAALIQYEKAADKENSQAQFFLADMLRRGEGTPKDNMEAYYYFLRALKNGNTLAYGPIVELEKTLPAADVETQKKLVDDIPSQKPKDEGTTP